ncbi:hypothetical protein [Zooshikella ganghwensis]|nr:hypothetical protein [Zooshikella ganghwensis]
MSNKVVVMPNQVIRWRGWKDFNTSDYPLEQRSFSLDIDGLYHIRWNVEKGIYVTKVSSYYDMAVRTYDDICIALFDKGDIYRIHQANKISFKYSIKTWDDTVYSIPFNPFAKINYEIISDKGSTGAMIVNAKGAYSFRPYFAKNPEETVQFEKSKNYVFLDSSDNLDNEVIYTKGSIILRDNEIIVSAQSAEPGVLIEENIANAEYLFIAGNIPLDKNYFITGINVSRSEGTMPTTGTLVGDLIYHDDYQMNNI